MIQVRSTCLICHNYYGNKYELQLHLTKKHEIKISVLTDIIYLLKNTEKCNINALLNNTNDDFKSQIIFNLLYKNYSSCFAKNLCDDSSNIITETLLAELGSQTVVEYLESDSDEDRFGAGKEEKTERCNWCSKSFSSKIVLLMHEEKSHNFLISSLIYILMENLRPNIFTEILEKVKSNPVSKKSVMNKKKTSCLNSLNDNNNNSYVKKDEFYYNDSIILLNNNYSFKNNYNKKNLQRTKLLDNQLKVLWKNFNINCSPNDDELEILAKKTLLNKKVIKHWFRNTLFKERQKNIESPYNFNNPPMSLL